MSGPVLAVDFGTSNSAAAMLDGGRVRRLPLEPGADTLPTAVFFPTGGTMRIGEAAAAALIDGEEGRYMRALKSVLGTPLFHEKRLIGGKRRTLAEVVTAFLSALKTGAEREAGVTFTHVLSGRPVHFHTRDADRDAQAKSDLRGCYEAAGFTEVDFLFEPEAAAHAAEPITGLGLIVDIGGGTSDFSVYRRKRDTVEILASHGIRLGGTDFDHAVSMAHAMPLLGLGGELTRSLADGRLPVPRQIYADLSTWAMIPFLYTAETRRMAQDLLDHAVDKPAMTRLVTVLRDELGHDLAFAVEAGKIAANSGTAAEIDMGLIEPRLAAPVTPGSLTRALDPQRDDLRTAVYETLFGAQVQPAQIDHVVLVGGSSLMELVTSELKAILPQARQQRSAAFTAVVDGLALASATR
ncbi:Hsp70 family protein [Mesobacterium pallidum]|uniref:Hsp70 family protein n=1 Tax=Mesobacterium pallidum TaxID=2872037 RepID=UPI001EE35F32|nr:Hsp70 family protein [Mesobacterium pallidum]